ncbi:MAG: FHA domain-containing protein [Anaerolineae bacterium]|nr:MAG: FHA domain-containing protein [Anaerolineae bacterium]
MTDLPAYVLVGLRILLAAALYAFLGAALILIWRDLKHTAVQQAEKQPPQLQLHPQGSEMAEAVLVFSQALLIGREVSCEVCLADETVSSSHARLWHSHGQWWVEDLGSRNGTFLNDGRLDTPAILAPGDVLRCGKARFLVDLQTVE